MSYDFTGTIHKIFDTEQIKETFRKREFVVEEPNAQYPNVVKFELIQDKCELLDPFNEGDTVTVSFDLSGRQWNDKFFTNLKAWRVQGSNGGGNNNGGGGQYAQPSAPAASQPANPFPASAPAADLGDGATKDDLPF